MVPSPPVGILTLNDAGPVPDPYAFGMALTWDGTLIRCDGTGCGRAEPIPAWTLYDQAVLNVDEWLEGRAWTIVAGRHYCPEHW